MLPVYVNMEKREVQFVREESAYEVLLVDGSSSTRRKLHANVKPHLT